MNVSQFLNAQAYPGAGQNARAKWVNKGSQITVAALTPEYNFFAAPLANPFTSNFQIPFSGDNVFFLKKMAAYIDTLDTALTGTIFNNIMQCFVEIWVNDRMQYKVSLAKIINFGFEDTLLLAGAGTTWNDLWKNEKTLVNPIVINSTANVRFRLHLNAAANAALVGNLITFVMTGFQFDKLSEFEYNDLQDNQFQRIDFDMYEIQPVVAAANNYQFFANSNQNEELFSKTLPLSESENFQVEAIQLLFSDQNVVAADHSLWYPRRFNRLTISLNDILYYDSYMHKALSYYGAYVAAGVSDHRLVLNQKDILETPIMIPAKSNNSVILQQPASVTPVAAQLVMLSFEGEITRRVA